MYRWLSMTLTLVLLSACTQRSCAEQAPAFIQAITPLYDAWQVTVVSADATQPAALGPQIADLRSIHQSVLAMQAPDCGRAAKVAFLVAVETATAELTARLDQQPAEVITANRSAALQAGKRAREEIQKLGVRQREIPNYLPPLHSNIEP